LLFICKNVVLNAVSTVCLSPLPPGLWIPEVSIGVDAIVSPAALSTDRVMITSIRFRSALRYVLVFIEIAHFTEEIILLVVLTGELLFATCADALDEIFSALLVKPRANLQLAGLFVLQAVDKCPGSLAVFDRRSFASPAAQI